MVPHNIENAQFSFQIRLFKIAKKIIYQNLSRFEITGITSTHLFGLDLHQLLYKIGRFGIKNKTNVYQGQNDIRNYRTHNRPLTMSKIYTA